MPFWKSAFALSIALAGFLFSPVNAIEMEDGPAYLTDSHGASGVARAFLELSAVAPEYDKYWKGSLDWLIAVAKRDSEGHIYWYMSTTAPKNHPSHRISVPGMCGMIRVFLAGHERCGDQRYRETALAGTQTLLRFARRRQTRYGTAYAWSHSYRPNDRSAGLLAGHSHGLGNLMSTLLDVYAAEPDEPLKTELKQALKGTLVNLRLRATTQTDSDGEVLIAWPALKNPNVIETGYCYGQAGLVLPLLQMAEVLPELKLSDGTTPLSLANGNLRYLMSVARPYRGGYVWPYMRHSKTSKNIGYGSGTGGIGWALLLGAHVNHGADPDFAAKCMKYARGAAAYAVQLVESNQGKARLAGPGGDAGFGVCGGVGGAGYFLMLYAKEAGETDSMLVARIRAAVEGIARAVIASAVELPDGTMACPDRVNFKRINIALDYGQTGVVLGLAGAGKYLKNDEIIAAAKKVADYIAKRAVPEGGGLKFAQFGPLPK